MSLHGLHRNPIDDAVSGFWPDAARRAPYFYPQGLSVMPQFAPSPYPVYAPGNMFAKLPPIAMLHPTEDLKDANKFQPPAHPPFVVTGTPIGNWAPLAGHDASIFSNLEGKTAEKGSKPRRKYTTCRRSVRAWTEEEHNKFLEGLEKFRTEDTQAMKENGELSVGLGPGIAEVISVFIGTRSVTQVRSHAQKYFQRQRREQNKAANSE